MEIKVHKRKRALVIELPLQKPALSSSGKTLLLATSGGVYMTAEKYRGKNIALNINAFVYAKAKPRERRKAHTGEGYQRRLTRSKKASRKHARQQEVAGNESKTSGNLPSGLDE